MKFKVGDRVKFVKSIYGHSSDVKVGEIYKIRKVDTTDIPYQIENLEWFIEEELEPAEYTYEDLKKSPIGTKITFENGNILAKTCENKFENETDISRIVELVNFTDRYYGKIIKIEEPAYRTVYEAKVEILDDVEKRYLRGVIRPYLDKIKSIEKFIFSTGRAKITITVKNDDSYWYIDLPPFKRDTMYKNMKDDKKYSLEELGL